MASAVLYTGGKKSESQTAPFLCHIFKPARTLCVLHISWGFKNSYLAILLATF